MYITKATIVMRIIVTRMIILAEFLAFFGSPCPIRFPTRIADACEIDSGNTVRGVATATEFHELNSPSQIPFGTHASRDARGAN
jgi:hypothetical protein